MNATISLDSLLTPLLSLSKANKKWIADHLYEDIKEEKAETMTKEELLNNIRQGMAEAKAIKEGKLKPITMEELLNEL